MEDRDADLNALRQEIASLKTRLNELERRTKVREVPLEKVDTLFTQLFQDLADHEIWQLFHETDPRNLASAVVGLDSRSLGRVRGNLSANAWRELVEEIKFLPDNSRHSTDARRSMLMTAMQLLEMGEIQSEELCVALFGEFNELPAYVPPTEEEKAATRKAEEERRSQHEQWLKTLDQVEAVKENRFVRASK